MPSTNIDNVIKMKSNLWICVRILSNANMKVASKKRICSIRARGYDGVMSRSEFTLLLPPSSSGTAQCHRSHGETALLISTNDDKMIRNFISLWKRKAQQQTNGKKNHEEHGNTFAFTSALVSICANYGIRTTQKTQWKKKQFEMYKSINEMTPTDRIRAF